MQYYYLAKTGQRFSQAEWMELQRTGESVSLLAKYGPAYTQEAWIKHHGTVGVHPSASRSKSNKKKVK